MSELEIHFQKKRELLGWISGKRSYELHYRSEGSRQGAHDAFWRAKDLEKIQALVDRFRERPGGLKDRACGPMIGRFLFPEKLPAHRLFQKMSPYAGELFLRGSASEPLFFNLPWELAAVGEGGSEKVLASYPLARMLDGCRAGFDAGKERLRVLYCISQPTELDSIDAGDFHQIVRSVLAERASLLDGYSCLGSGQVYQPKFSHLLEEIRACKPNVLILTCHGRTTEQGPELAFSEGWQKVQELAERLSDSRSTFLVVLLACDQVFLKRSSGAQAFLRSGIPAVIAMQGSVLVPLAKIFLGRTLDLFLLKSSLLTATREGRVAMRRHARSPGLDWVFPALFVCENFREAATAYREVLSDWEPFLWSLRRSIPRPTEYERDDAAETACHAMFEPQRAGLGIVTGEQGVGKSYLVRNLSCSLLQEAIESRNAAFRPILYIDLQQREPASPWSILNAVEEAFIAVREAHAGIAYLEWPTARGHDGSGFGQNPARLLRTAFDHRPMVAVLDHVSGLERDAWRQLMAELAQLERSRVVLISQDLPAAAAVPLNTAIFRLERKGHGRGHPDIPIPDAAVTLAHKLAFFEEGLTTALTLRFLAEPEDGDLLTHLTYLERAHRFGGEWLCVPRFYRDPDWEDEKVKTALGELFDRFVSFLSEPSTGGLLHNAQTLWREPGSELLLKTVQRLFILCGQWDLAGSIPMAFHNLLFEQGRWGLAYELWNAYLEAVPRRRARPDEWLKLSAAARQMGDLQRTKALLDRIDLRRLNPFDRADYYDQKASLLKDLGVAKYKVKIRGIYEKALSAIGTASRNAADEVGQREAWEKRAVILYNRALFQRFGEADLPAAITALVECVRVFRQLENRTMEALSRCEWVDVQMDVPQLEPDWNAMRETLFTAIHDLDGLENLGDLAFCYYTLARLYRRLPFEAHLRRLENLKLAGQAYERAAECAQRHGDLRQHAIAAGHAVEIAWEVHGLDPGDGASPGNPFPERTARLDRLTGAILFLERLHQDAWSRRVHRDFLLLRAQIAAEEDSGSSLGDLKAAWASACAPPLHPDFGFDARKAAAVLSAYLEALARKDARLELARLAFANRKLIQQWLRQSIDPGRFDDWKAELATFAKGETRWVAKEEAPALPKRKSTA